MNRVWCSPESMEMTSSADGVSHLIRQTDYEAGLIGRTGQYLTVCKLVILTASMSTAPGRKCRACRQSV